MHATQKHQSEPESQPTTTPEAPVQRRASLRGVDFDSAVQMLAPVQAKDDSGAVHAAAQRGTSGGGGSLPYLGQIQKSFGGHDVSGIKAHTGGNAGEACESMGAEAYASGQDVAFKGQPDLHTAAHEAAHIVQQRSGVQLSGGVGKAGDSYEQNADAVADRVVQGKSAADLLGGASWGGAAAVQRSLQMKGAVGTPTHASGPVSGHSIQRKVARHVQRKGTSKDVKPPPPPPEKQVRAAMDIIWNKRGEFSTLRDKFDAAILEIGQEVAKVERSKRGLNWSAATKATLKDWATWVNHMRNIAGAKGAAEVATTVVGLKARILADSVLNNADWKSKTLFGALTYGIDGFFKPLDPVNLFQLVGSSAVDYQLSEMQNEYDGADEALLQVRKMLMAATLDRRLVSNKFDELVQQHAALQKVASSLAK